MAQRCPRSSFLDVKVIEHTWQEDLVGAKEGVLEDWSKWGDGGDTWPGALILGLGGIVTPGRRHSLIA